MDEETAQTAQTENPVQQVVTENPEQAFDYADVDFSEASVAAQQVQEEEEYSLGFSDEDGLAPDFISDLTQAAKSSGLEAASAKKFVLSAIEGMKKREQEMLLSHDKKLQSDWGSGFKERVHANQVFLASVSNEAGLKKEDVALLLSPQGMRVVDVLRRRVAEQPMARAQHTPQMTREQQIDDMMFNPKNPYNKGLTDLNASLEQKREAYRQLNKVAGVPIMPIY